MWHNLLYNLGFSVPFGAVAKAAPVVEKPAPVVEKPAPVAAPKILMVMVLLIHLINVQIQWQKQKLILLDVWL